MKTKSFLLILLSLIGLAMLTTLAGCGRRGNGRVVTEERKVTPFTKLSISGVFPIEISQTGEPESVKVEADENLQNYIDVRNEGE
ncbi:MAG: hypothetical protein IPP77_07615 [Bacteroidetes bacterium]|nr:hypothetical protein [Bacteroidota bacterium]